MADPEQKCPGAETATITDAKLSYLLNPDPAKSGGKAVVFAAAGFTASNAADLRDVLLSGLQGAAATASVSNGGGGTNYVARMAVPGPSATLDLQTVWAANPEGTHLVTAYPFSRGKKGGTNE